MCLLFFLEQTLINDKICHAELLFHFFLFHLSIIHLVQSLPESMSVLFGLIYNLDVSFVIVAVWFLLYFDDLFAEQMIYFIKFY